MSRTTTPRVSRHPSYPASGRVPVLIVGHSDGWIEAYAERHVDVRIEIAPYMTTPEGERLAEGYVELSLPRRYRDLYWPGMRRAGRVPQMRSKASPAGKRGPGRPPKPITVCHSLGRSCMMLTHR